MMKEISEQSQSESVEIVTDEDESSTSSANLFSLKWNGFEEQVCNGFASLLYSGDLADVTLACDGQLIKAHKVVLAMCSPFFRKIFSENPCKHPIVIIKGIKFREVKNVLHFIYLGEVRVHKHEINEFFEAADSLKIDGLDCEPEVGNPSHNDLKTGQSGQTMHDENIYERRETDSYGHHSSKSYHRQRSGHGRYENEYSPPNSYSAEGVHDTPERMFSENPEPSTSIHHWSGSHMQSGGSSIREDVSPGAGGSAMPMSKATKRYHPSCTVVSSDVMQSDACHSEIRNDEVDLSMHHRRVLSPYNPHCVDQYENTHSRSNSAEREYALSLPDNSSATSSSGVIMSTSVSRPNRPDFEPKWETPEMPPEVPTTSPSITNPNEPFIYRTTSTTIPPHYSSPRYSLSAQKQSEADNFSLGLGPKSSTGPSLSLVSHGLPLVPVSLNLSGQSSSSAISSLSPSAPSTSQSHSTHSQSTSQPTSTLSALRAKISSGHYPSHRAFRGYYPGTSLSLSTATSGPIATVPRRAELPNPKTKQIRSSQVPPSSRYTATEVDAMVDQVQHLPGNLVPCALCQKVVKRERLRAHIHECHLLHGERIICPHCGIGLKSKGSFRVHIWRHKRGTLSSRLHPN